MNFSRWLASNFCIVAIHFLIDHFTAIMNAFTKNFSVDESIRAVPELIDFESQSYLQHTPHPPSPLWINPWWWRCFTDGLFYMEKITVAVTSGSLTTLYHWKLLNANGNSYETSTLLVNGFNLSLWDICQINQKSTLVLLWGIFGNEPS